MKDLAVDGSAFDRIIASGGFITAPTGTAIDGNAIPVPKPASDLPMDAAACIGCGACVASDPNGSAALFTSAKIGHLGMLPQVSPARSPRPLDGGDDHRRGLRSLHERRRVPRRASRSRTSRA